MEATSAPPILLPGIDHLPCLQAIRSVKDKPFLLPVFCGDNAVDPHPLPQSPYQPQAGLIGRDATGPSCDPDLFHA